jgi:peptidoglycan/LPS O-acetylase OafA/YrhL
LAPHYPTEQTYLIGAFTYYWLPSQLVIFSLGILLFFFLRDQLSGRYSTQEKLMHGEMGYREAVFLIMIFLYLSVAAAFPYNLLIPAFFIYGLAFLALGWSLAIRPLPIFVNFLTTYAGKVSYSAYLVHFFVVDVCSRNLAPYSIYFHPTVYFLIFLAISFLGTIAISTCTFLAIEQPGQALGKKIIKIINGKNLRGFSLETHGSTW